MESVATQGGSILGHAVKRLEDPALIQGLRHYAGDLTRPDMLHVAFVRSGIAHGTITEIDTAFVPEGAQVFTSADLDLSINPPPMIPATFARPVLAKGRVRYVGDPVVAVLADSERAAVDAASEIFVDYDPLPPIASVEQSLADDAPILFPDAGTNVAWSGSSGNDDDPLAGAEVVVSQRMVQQRLAPVTMEPGGMLAEPDGKGGVHVQMGTQDPAGARRVLSASLGLDPSQVRVMVPAMGGGFGAKGPTYPEHVVCAALALRLGRPVRWLERRTENLIHMVHGRAQVQHVEMGATRDGRVVGLRAHYVTDAGGYPTIAASFGKYTMMMSSGVYDIPKMALSAEGVVTTMTPVGPYRGAGRPEATQMIERLMDLLAVELDMDPVAVRRRNLLAPFNSELVLANGTSYDSGDYAATLDHALDQVGWQELVAERDARRASGDSKLIGLGVSAYVETTIGITPKGEAGGITVDPDGTIVVRAGGSSHGQGHQTTFSQLAADRFGVPMDQVRVLQSDTDLVPDGVAGTYASRTLQLVGSSMMTSADAVIARATELAADMLEASPTDIIQVPGGLGVAGVPDAMLTWSALATEAADRGEEPLEADLVHTSADATYPFGTHVSVVEVDTDTGWVRLLRHLSFDDCGHIINPMLVLGQQHGGVAQGIGQALFEDAAFDDQANPLRPNLVGYTIPTAVDLPMIETGGTVTPTPLNPLGAKGVGEAGTLGSTPAIQSAVMDALKPLGVRHIDLPLTPSRVWQAIQDAAG
jgi:carbon-monoxide dehydrogenase large subunit